MIPMSFGMFSCIHFSYTLQLCFLNIIRICRVLQLFFCTWNSIIVTYNLNFNSWTFSSLISKKIKLGKNLIFCFNPSFDWIFDTPTWQTRQANRPRTKCPPQRKRKQVRSTHVSIMCHILCTYLIAYYLSRYVWLLLIDRLWFRLVGACSWPPA